MSNLRLQQEILHLQQQLKEKKEKYFLERLISLIDSDVNLNNISNIKLNILDNQWSVTYIHKTSEFKECDYDYEQTTIPAIEQTTDSTIEQTTIPAIEQTTIPAIEQTTIPAIEKTTIITFGEAENPYIIGTNTRNRFKLYYNSSDILRIINNDYSIELDISEQSDLIDNYSNNPNIPEWFALKIFKFLANNDWKKSHIILYLSII